MVRRFGLMSVSCGRGSSTLHPALLVQMVPNLRLPKSVQMVRLAHHERIFPFNRCAPFKPFGMLSTRTGTPMLSQFRKRGNKIEAIGPSPTDSFKSGHLIEVRIVAENRQHVLPCQSGNPEVVLRYGLASETELMTDVSINATGF